MVTFTLQKLVPKKLQTHDQSKTMYQHYLPVCYLKQFTEISTTERREPSLWLFNRAMPEKGWYRKAPRKMAGEKNFYSFRDKNGEWNHGLEKAFQLVENEYAPLIQRLAYRDSAPSEQECLGIATFMACQLARVPDAIEQTKNQVALLQETFFEQLFANSTADEGYFKEKVERWQKQTDLDLSKLRPNHLDPQNLKIEVPTSYAVAQSLLNTSKIVQLFMSMGWRFYRASGGSSYITSDNPVVTANPEATSDIFGRGWAARDAEITFPLTRELAVMLSWNNERHATLINAPVEYVEFFNLRTFLGADKLVIASHASFPGSIDVNEALSSLV